MDVLQLDEPYLQAQPDRARAYAIPAIDRAAGRARQAHRHPPVLRLRALPRARRDDEAQRLFFPARARAVRGPPGVDRSRPARLDLAVFEALPSKTIVLGVLDLGDPTPETPDVVAWRLEAALRRLPVARLVAAPDCGMKYLPRPSPCQAPGARRGHAPGRVTATSSAHSLLTPRLDGDGPCGRAAAVHDLRRQADVEGAAGKKAPNDVDELLVPGHAVLEAGHVRTWPPLTGPMLGLSTPRCMMPFEWRYSIASGPGAGQPGLLWRTRGSKASRFPSGNGL